MSHVLELSYRWLGVWQTLKMSNSCSHNSNENEHAAKLDRSHNDNLFVHSISTTQLHFESFPLDYYLWNWCRRHVTMLKYSYKIVELELGCRRHWKTEKNSFQIDACANTNEIKIDNIFFLQRMTSRCRNRRSSLYRAYHNYFWPVSYFNGSSAFD